MTADIDRFETARTFYDTFSANLLVDFVYGNPRAEAAIKHSIRWIPQTARRILDIGCGIGWSSWELKRHFKAATVQGVDLSPQMINLAQKLFSEPGLEFKVQDISQPSSLLSPPVDVIVLLDIYEHIPEDLREQTHRLLNKTLCPDGTIILTCPSAQYQNYLSLHHPEALQPVDETVTFDHVAQLAKDIGGDVVCFNYVNIWNSNDYFHAVIQRHVAYGKPKAYPVKSDLAAPRERSQRVSERLDMEVTPEGTILNHHQKTTLCIVTPNRDTYSETFIEAHIERLPANIRLLYGGFYPTRRDNAKRIVPMPWIALARVIQRFSPGDRRIEDLFLQRFFKRNDLVLAEYGVTGVQILDACKKAKIPLVVHFHGFDAYEEATLAQSGKRYPELFAYASAIIAVSRDMEAQLLSLGAPREKLYYNCYGVDPTLFKSAEPEKAPPHFVAVGRFTDKKAPHLTILAFKKVIEKVSNASLLMIGDGELLEACKILASALHLDHAVEFSGARSHSSIAEAMRKARAFVQHSVKASYGDSEGTPVAVLEASASGLPVISTRHAGIPDVVIHGQTGFLVEEKDIDGMAEYMVQVATNPALASQLGKAAQERVRIEFSMEKSIGNLWAILDRIVQEHRKA